MTVKQLWEAIKWSNQNKDGSVTISIERVKGIDDAMEKECSKQDGR